MDNGWIKLHRKLKDKGYYKKSQYVHLWVHLLLEANHKPKEFLWNNEIIIIKEGQLLTGRKALSEQTGIKQTNVERILKMLENEHQIGQQKTSKFRVITILKWKQYQIVDNKTDNKRTASGQQVDTNKNVRMKRMKRIRERETQNPPTELVLDYFKELGHEQESEKFYNYYTANGWTTSNGNSVKDWKALCRNWISRIKTQGNIPPVIDKSEKHLRKLADANFEKKQIDKIIKSCTLSTGLVNMHEVVKAVIHGNNGLSTEHYFVKQTEKLVSQYLNNKKLNYA